jgi:hypothetical protein
VESVEIGYENDVIVAPLHFYLLILGPGSYCKFLGFKVLLSPKESHDLKVSLALDPSENPP